MHRTWKLIGCSWICGMLALMASGCQGGGGRASIRVPTEQQHDFSGDTVRLPEERAFNIHLKQSSQNPGPEGEARGASDATSDGTAYARAEAVRGGESSAEFTLGHRVNHQSDRAHEVAILVEYTLEQSVSADDPPEAGTRAEAVLQLIVQDQKRRQVAQMPLVTLNSDDARESGSSAEKRHLKLTFEPATSYDVYLFGKIDATSSKSQEAAGELKISNLKLRFEVGSATPGESA